MKRSNPLNLITTPATRKCSKPSSTVATPCTPPPVSPALPIKLFNLMKSPEPRNPRHHNVTFGSPTTLGLNPEQILEILHAVPLTEPLSDCE